MTRLRNPPSGGLCGFDGRCNTRMLLYPPIPKTRRPGSTMSYLPFARNTGLSIDSTPPGERSHDETATVEPPGSGGVSPLSGTNPRRSGLSAESGHFAHRRLRTACQPGDRGPVAEVRNEVRCGAISLRNSCARRWTGACGRYRAMELARALLFRSTLAEKC